MNIKIHIIPKTENKICFLSELAPNKTIHLGTKKMKDININIIITTAIPNPSTECEYQENQST